MGEVAEWESQSAYNEQSAARRITDQLRDGLCVLICCGRQEVARASRVSDWKEQKTHGPRATFKF